MRGAPADGARVPTLDRVDPSALIFVALAVAWAVYLIPKALEHHEEGSRSRSVDAFSHSVRVLARREPVSRREALLVAGDEPAPPTRRELRREARARVGKKEARIRRRNTRRLAAAARIPSDPRLRRRAAALAARRRLRVVTLILAANAVVGILAATGTFALAWTLVPVVVLVAWLVACRLMVRRERAELPMIHRTDRARRTRSEDKDATQGIPVVAEEVPEPRDPNAWDPVDVPLPTYVSKPVATRTRQHHRPRLHRRLDLRTQRGRQRARPRERAGRRGPGRRGAAPPLRLLTAPLRPRGLMAAWPSTSSSPVSSPASTSRRRTTSSARRR